MKRLISFVVVALLATAAIYPCTNFLVGKKASADGSTIVSYSADSYNLYGELYHWQAAQYRPGTMLKVYEWDTGKFLGEIPQALLREIRPKPKPQPFARGAAQIPVRNNGHAALDAQLQQMHAL